VLHTVAQRLQILFHYLPDLAGVDLKIVMNKYVPHACGF
jgi:hypothetical protein